VTLNTGGGVDTVNVQAAAFSSGAGLTVDSSAGSGADVINLGDAANTLGGITGPVTVTGAPGDALVVNDQGTAAAQTYTITGTTLTWAGGPTVTYGGVWSLTVNGGSGGNHFNVEGTDPSVALGTTLNAGTGGDVFLITPTSQYLANIAGPLTLTDSGSGADALEFFDQMNPAAETYFFDATPSNLTLTTVPVSINFTWVGPVYLEANGASTVNDASGTVLVDVPPPPAPAPSSSDDGDGVAHVLLDTAPKGAVAAADAPPVGAATIHTVPKGDVAPADAPLVTDAVMVDLFRQAGQKSRRGL
jgi:hypothetical protein